MQVDIQVLEVLVLTLLIYHQQVAEVVELGEV